MSMSRSLAPIKSVVDVGKQTKKLSSFELRREYRIHHLEHPYHCHGKMVSTKYASHMSTKDLTSTSNGASKSIISNSSDLNTKRFDQDEKLKKAETSDYTRAIQDLNLLQSNTQVIALAKYKNPEAILPLFRKQMQLAGVQVEKLNCLNVLHVSGTKGKGSTCAFAESILRYAGLKTGFYNSPHLIKVTERIRLNGSPIDEALFAKYFRQIFDRLLDGTEREKVTMPSYFSFLTILAFHIFLEEQVDCAVIEVGMGGEYDPTNVIEKPVACGITTLDFDHTNVLGTTIESIAWNKAGIIKAGVPVFTIKHEQEEAMKVIEERAMDKRSPMHVCQPIDSNALNLGIPSSAQYANAALACRLANCLLQKRPSLKHQAVTIDEHSSHLPPHLLNGLERCRWPGRCQVVELNDKMCFFLDGAHTKKSMENCLEWFINCSRARHEDVQQVLMLNVIGERDKAEVLRPLSNYDGFTHVIFSTNRINTAGDTPKSETFVNLQGPNSEKSLDNVRSNARVWASLRKHSSSVIIMKANTYEAFKAIEQLADVKRCHVLATGSLHFVGAVLETMSMIDGRDNL